MPAPTHRQARIPYTPASAFQASLHPLSRQIFRPLADLLQVHSHLKTSLRRESFSSFLLRLVPRMPRFRWSRVHDQEISQGTLLSGPFVKGSLVLGSYVARSPVIRRERTVQPFTITGVRIGLASPAQIRSWSSGEVKEPTTINYRTQKPEKDGLFCERIFGPTQDWTCACRKYIRQRRAGQVCEQCGVALAPARVRRERMGHIELSVPVVHPWFLRGAPSILSLLLRVR